MGQYRPSTFKWVNLDPQLLFLDQTRFLLMWHSILKRKVYFVLSTSPSLLMCQSSPLLPQHDHFTRPLVAASFSLLTTVILLPTAARNGERVSWHCCCCYVLISSSSLLLSAVSYFASLFGGFNPSPPALPQQHGLRLE